MRQRFFFFLSLLFVLASLTPTFYELYRRNDLLPERYFELVHNFPTDYNFYLSRIRQGIEGKLTVVEQYTSEQHNGSFIQVLYLAMGWTGRWTRVPWERAGDVYHVARSVLGVVLLFLIAQLALRSFKSFGWQIIAFLLAVTASTWPKFVLEWDGWRFGGYMPWWSVMDSLQRITFIPHLLLGQSLILFLLMALSDVDVLAKPGNWIVLGLLGFILGIIFPPGLLFVITASILIMLIRFLMEVRSIETHVRMQWFIRNVWPLGVFFAISFPSLLYLSLIVSIYPWKRLAELDILHPLPFEYIEYLKAVGSMLPLGLIGLLLALWRKEKQMLVSIAWVLSWILLLLLFRFVPQQSPLRFSEMIPHVPLGMLVAYLFFVLYSRTLGAMTFFAHPSNRLVSMRVAGAGGPPRRGPLVGILGGKPPTGPALRSHRMTVLEKAYRLVRPTLVIPMVIIIVGLGVMYSSWLWQRDFIDHKIRSTYPLVPTGTYVMYPLKDFIAAIKYIQDATSRDTVILSETTAGNYMPVYSGNTVYVGHDNTVAAEEKRERVTDFFRGTMNPNTAYEWLKRDNLQYIFFGPQEREDGGVAELSSIYPFLNKVYTNTFVTIYSTR